ncbi:MAG: DUF4276 family protein [Candidatus Delongbacteria bacterium]|nr:DUF4276 family protein [Candidatus Delongbacteria bacterium]MCG2760405.1 DUF4276 family protein [Candidatus Delongbacteria bacterium]
MIEINIGLIAEGPTDNRFLESVVKRTFDTISCECTGAMIVNLYVLKRKDYKTDKFVKLVNEASKDGFEKYGIKILCVHTDADFKDDSVAISKKIIPSIKSINKLGDEYCKNLVAIVPVQMTEAWMLADKDLLKREIGTEKPDSELKIQKTPEEYSDPKAVIESAIRIARAQLTQRKRKDLKINELYQPIGHKIPLEKLDALDSYQKFKNEIRFIYRKLNYLS